MQSSGFLVILFLWGMSDVHAHFSLSICLICALPSGRVTPQSVRISSTGGRSELISPSPPGLGWNFFQSPVSSSVLLSFLYLAPAILLMVPAWYCSIGSIISCMGVPLNTILALFKAPIIAGVGTALSFSCMISPAPAITSKAQMIPLLFG